MSEKVQFNHEVDLAREIGDNPNLSASKQETNSPDNETSQETKINKYRETINQELTINSPKELPIDDSPQGSQYAYVDRKTKKQILKKELELIQSELDSSNKLLSKVIHQQAIKNISEASSKTIARPYGFMGGAISSFLGSLAYYMFTKYYGIHYYNFVFIILFIVGYVLTTLIEIIARRTLNKKNS